MELDLKNDFSLSMLFNLKDTNGYYVETLLKYKGCPIYIDDLAYDDVKRFSGENNLKDHVKYMTLLFQTPIVMDLTKKSVEDLMIKLELEKKLKERNDTIEKFVDMFEKSKMGNSWQDVERDGFLFSVPISKGKLVMDFSDVTMQDSICSIYIVSNDSPFRLTNTDEIVNDYTDLMDKLLEIKTDMDFTACNLKFMKFLKK